MVGGKMMKKHILHSLIFLSAFTLHGMTTEQTQIELQQDRAQFATMPYTAGMEREVYDTNDSLGRIVFAVQTVNPKAVKVDWKIFSGLNMLASGTGSLEKGLLCVDFSLAGLKPSEYRVEYAFQNALRTGNKSGVFPFFIQEGAKAVTKGQIKLVTPEGFKNIPGGYPLSAGIPFPKGALKDKDAIILRDTAGNVLPCQTVVRSKWGAGKDDSICWLGVDFQAPDAKAYWPGRKDHSFILEYGTKGNPTPKQSLKFTETPDAFNISTGAKDFRLDKKSFDFIDLYLKDHQGTLYRAANDRDVRYTIEESGPLKLSLKAEGWYVREGSDGATQNYTLPTDRLCKFICRLEFHAGKSYVHVVNSTVFTFDSFTMRLTDLGMRLPLGGVSKAVFGEQGKDNIETPVPKEGVRLLQHMYNQFTVETDSGIVKTGEKALGTVRAGGVEASLRDTWHRYPKELEVRPDAMILHIWPAHGKTHPEIDITKHENMHKLIFAHTGREMNLVMPWDCVKAAAKISDSDEDGVYKPFGHLMAARYVSALGLAVTADAMIDFDVKDEAAGKLFLRYPFVMASPDWNMKSMAFGYSREYDPEQFPALEKSIENYLYGYEALDDRIKDYGMWVFGRYHHSAYKGDGKFDLYRLNGGTHHHEALMPYLFLARSGNADYVPTAFRRIRTLTDLTVIHHADSRYPQKEFHFGQTNIVGSQRHTNGYFPWGGDHSLGGHLTCYEGYLFAYYMTGDRRFLDAVDEWHNTLVNDRLNPNYADRSCQGGRLMTVDTSARDICNSIGECMRLYQHTNDPKVAALYIPRLQSILKNIVRNWGDEYNIIATFHGSKEFRDIITSEAMQVIKQMGDKSGQGHNSLGAYGYLNYSLSSIFDPANAGKYAAHAAIDVDEQRRLLDSKSFADTENNRMATCVVPDQILHLPLYMHAANGRNASAASAVTSAVFPFNCAANDICIIKEDSDREITLNIKAYTKVPYSYSVYGTENELIGSKTEEIGSTGSVFTIPKDGRTGQYAVVFRGLVESKMTIDVPFTDLPEVYFISKYWSQRLPSRYFAKPYNRKTDKLELSNHVMPGAVFKSDGVTLLVQTDSVIGTDKKLSFTIPEDGFIVSSKARYISSTQPLLFSVSPSNFFEPDALKRKLIETPPKD